MEEREAKSCLRIGTVPFGVTLTRYFTTTNMFKIARFCSPSSERIREAYHFYNHFLHQAGVTYAGAANAYAFQVVVV
jgi:hypothetical protein